MNHSFRTQLAIYVAHTVIYTIVFTIKHVKALGMAMINQSSLLQPIMLGNCDGGLPLYFYNIL